MWRARPSVYASACLLSGSRPGTVTSAPCNTRSYGSSQRRTDQTERHRGVEHDEIGAEVAGEVVDLAHHERVRQQHRLAGALDAERLLGVERRRVGVRAREHGEACRAGRRRHHSQSNDWMPPILGGKSFVTSRCFMHRRRFGVSRMSSAASRGQTFVRPGRVFGEDRIGPRTVAVEHLADTAVSSGSPTLPMTTSAFRRTHR